MNGLLELFFAKLAYLASFLLPEEVDQFVYVLGQPLIECSKDFFLTLFGSFQGFNPVIDLDCIVYAKQMDFVFDFYSKGILRLNLDAVRLEDLYVFDVFAKDPVYIFSCVLLIRVLKEVKHIRLHPGWKICRL